MDLLESVATASFIECQFPVFFSRIFSARQFIRENGFYIN